MKQVFSTNLIASFIAISLITSCSDSVEDFNIVDSSKEVLSNNNVHLFKFGSRSISKSDDLILRPSIPNNEESFTYFLFYELEDGPTSNAWRAIPEVNIDENYKIYHTREESSDLEDTEILKVSIADYDSQSSSERRLHLKNIQVLAVEVSALGTLAMNVNVKDHQMILEYFNISD